MAQPDAYVTVATASQLTGVPVRTLHRWVARGQLHAMAGQHGRLVDLDAVRHLAAAAGHPAATPEPLAGHVVTGTPLAEGGAPWQVMTELVAVNDRLSRENVELAGRCGWLQAQLEAATSRIRELEAPRTNQSAAVDQVDDQAPSETGKRPAASGNGPRIEPERPAGRPWWAFWRW